MGDANMKQRNTAITISSMILLTVLAITNMAFKGPDGTILLLIASGITGLGGFSLSKSGDIVAALARRRAGKRGGADGGPCV